MSDFWRDRRTFVTGGTGLLGGWLTRRLVEEGADVVVLIRDWEPRSVLLSSPLRDRVTIVRGDVRDQPLLERALGEYEVDAVFHLAAQTIVGVANRNAVDTFDTNIRGTWALLEACRRSPLVSRVVVASSDKAYGEHERLPYTEETPLRARKPYDVSKACADMIAATFAEVFGVPVAVTRCGNFFGGGDLNWSRLVPGTIRSVVRGERPVLRSDGTSLRDYIFVDDAVDGYLVLAERLSEDLRLPGSAVNLSTESPQTALDLCRRVLKLMRSDLEPEVRADTRHEIPDQHLDATRARELLDWKPRFGLDDGLVKTVEWYRGYFASSGEVGGG